MPHLTTIEEPQDDIYLYGFDKHLNRSVLLGGFLQGAISEVSTTPGSDFNSGFGTLSNIEIFSDRGLIGGWSITSTAIVNGNLTLNSSAPSFIAGPSTETRTEIVDGAIHFYDDSNVRRGELSASSTSYRIGASDGSTTRFFHFRSDRFDCTHGFAFGNQTDFGIGDTTPSVTARCYIKTANTSATTITQFDDGVTGQILIIQFDDDNTTIQDNVDIQLSGGSDFVGTTNDILTLIRDQTSEIWYEVSRSVN